MKYFIWCPIPVQNFSLRSWLEFNNRSHNEQSLIFIFQLRLFFRAIKCKNAPKNIIIRCDSTLFFHLNLLENYYPVYQNLVLKFQSGGWPYTKNFYYGHDCFWKLYLYQSISISDFRPDRLKKFSSNHYEKFSNRTWSSKKIFRIPNKKILTRIRSKLCLDPPSTPTEPPQDPPIY